MSSISEERYHEACDSYEGYCTECKDFTRETTEPDAEGYDCPKCDGDTVMGAEQAMITGEVEIE